MWRILSVAGAGQAQNQHEPLDAVGEFNDVLGSQAEVATLAAPTAAQLQAKLREMQPMLVYLYGNLSPGVSLDEATVSPFRLTDDHDPAACYDPTPEQIGAIFEGLGMVEGVFLNATCLDSPGQALKAVGVQQFIHWTPHQLMPAISAVHFAHVFFALLRNPTITVPESFAVSWESTQVQHLTLVHVDRGFTTLQAHMLSDVLPELPSNASIPLPEVHNVDLSAGVTSTTPGWDSIRLLAPRAEVVLHVCGTAAVMDHTVLTHLGQALRALLAAEMRQLGVVDSVPAPHHPAHVDACALQCTVQTVSGAHTTVVLGGESQILANVPLVQHALRQCLVVDALCLQARLPPVGLRPVDGRAQAWVAHGVSTVQVLISTSLWVVDVLRLVALNSQHRGLAVLGVAAVGASPVEAFNGSDAEVFACAVALQTRTPPPTEAGVSYAVQADMGAPVGMPQGLPLVEWRGGRPSLDRCTEEDFRADLMAFLESREHKVDPGAFPPAVLNGSTLDVFNLYKEVCKRGGFKMGNGINWKGQVFPQMRNFTDAHKLTGVGNALKRHYQNFLLEYEEANAASDLQQ